MRSVSRHAQYTQHSSTSPTITGLQRLITSRKPCADPRESRGDGFTDPEPRTGYEPKRIVDKPTITDQEIAHSTEESQITEIEDKGLICDPYSLPYNQSLLSSTQDSIESIATPQEADLDDEQIRAMLASPRYLPEREASAECSQVYHSEREILMASSSQGLNFIGTGEPVALFSQKGRSNQDPFSEREQPVDVLRSDESIFRNSNPANVAKSLLDGNGDHLLTQARSELMKQEHKVESLNNCISELQRQAYAQRLELENAPITDTLNLDENKFDNKKNQF